MSSALTARPEAAPAARALRRGRGDPAVVGLVALVVYCLHGFHGVLDRDLGIFVYGGEQVARGTPPYTGVFNSVGPLADLVPGLAIRFGDVVGVGPVISARVAFVLLAALSCALLSLLARDVLGSRAAGLVAPAVMLTFARYLELASGGPREKTTMVVLMLGALLLVRHRRWLGAGVLIALATLTWQPVLLILLAAVVAAAWVGGEPRRTVAARVLMGGAIPTLVAVGYFAVTGTLGRAVDGFVLINVLYTRQPSALTSPLSTSDLLWDGYGAGLLVLLAGLVVLLARGWAAFNELRAIPVALRQDRSELSVAVVTLAAGGVVGLVWTVLVVNGSPDLFALLPFGAVGASIAVLAAARRLPGVLGPVLVVAVSTLGLVVGLAISLSTRDDRLVIQRDDVAAVLATQPPGATVLSIDAPQVLAFSGRTNPTPYQIFDPPMAQFLDHRYPGGTIGYGRTVDRLRPTFIAVGSIYDGSWADGLLRRHYWRVGHAPQWTWYLDKRAGVAALLEARQANDAVAGDEARQDPSGAELRDLDVAGVAGRG